MNDFHIYTDEAWTHSSDPMGRYWCFFGGVFGSQSDLDKLNQDYQKVRDKYGFHKEIKWSSLNERNEHIYKEFVDQFFNFLIQDNTVIYRQFFLDRSFIHKESYDNNESLYTTRVQFKLYYQFLKHCFPINKLENCSTIHFHLDDHTSPYKNNLNQYLKSLWLFDTSSVNTKVSYVRSSKTNHIQVVDIITGMSGYRGNKVYFKTLGSRKKKKLKQSFSQYVYEHIRYVDGKLRGSKNFNLFNSTSSFKYRDKPFNQKILIWGFKPSNYYIDKGWENDHLSKKGEYQGADIQCPRKNKS